MKKMLVVDDLEINRRILTDIFESEYEVLVACDGVEALDIITKLEGRIDVIVLDLVMPVMDGFQVLQELSEHTMLSEIPAVVVTSQSDVKNEIKALELGATDVITRPFDAEIIRQRIRNVMRKQELLQACMEIRFLREARIRANYDSLTKIYNKPAFCDATTKMLRENQEQQFVLIRYNIERFRVMNDMIGVERADQLLVEIADIIKQKVVAKGQGTYGRFEADNFVVCMPKELFSIEEMGQLLNSCKLSEQAVYGLIIDMGIYEINDIEMPVIKMCDYANLALQTINGNYDKHYAFYDDKLRLQLLEEQEILSEMHTALEKGEFVVYLQPIYSIEKGIPVSAEALIRWMHPVKGLIPPGMFIPLFEKNGFISKLDSYVWENVCRYQRKRIDEGVTPIPISVNTSRYSFYNDNLADEIIGLVNKYQISPDLVKIEITESAYNDNPDLLLKTIRKMQEFGLNILMDDFGSGYSSLNTLKDIPVDVLKIDMKFMEDFESSKKAASILTSVVRMAKWINIAIIAEGVERKIQIDFLRSIGCDHVQGYYFARPLPMNEFEELLDKKIDSEPVETIERLENEEIEAIFGGTQFISKIIDGMFHGIAIYEMHEDRLKLLHANDNYLDFLGYTPKIFVDYASNVLAGLYQADIPVLLNACKKTAETHETVSARIRKYHSNGKLLYLECVLHYCGGTLEKPHICIAFHDISNQCEQEQNLRDQTHLLQKSEERLIESKQKLEEILENLQVGIAIYELDNDKVTLLYGNQYYYHGSGYNRDEYRTFADNVEQLLHGEDQHKIKQLIRDKVSRMEQLDFDYRIITKEGRTKWLHLKASPIRYGNHGKPTYLASLIEENAFTRKT